MLMFFFWGGGGLLLVGLIGPIVETLHLKTDRWAQTMGNLFFLSEGTDSHHARPCLLP